MVASPEPRTLREMHERKVAADLRRFVLDQLDRIDIRKVEKFAFVALLTAAPAASAE